MSPFIESVRRTDGLVLNAPAIFEDPDFKRWLHSETPKFTWASGGVTNEWSDVVVLVEPSLTGEGSDADMPQHCWAAIVEACREAGLPTHHDSLIVVRITNLAV